MEYFWCCFIVRLLLYRLVKTIIDFVTEVLEPVTGIISRVITTDMGLYVLMKTRSYVGTFLTLWGALDTYILVFKLSQLLDFCLLRTDMVKHRKFLHPLQKSRSGYQRLTTFPFSLNQYVDDIVRERASAEDLMKYELSRYLSFKTFPMDSIMTPMRLAQAGFYYTGHGEQVKCFCCGLTNGNWSAGETAVEVHKRLSPNCRFIRRETSSNVEIHNLDYYYGLFHTPSRSGNSLAGRLEPGAGITSGPAGPLDQALRVRYTGPTASTQPSSRDHSAHADQTPVRPPNPATDQDRLASRNAKYPQYADLALRMDSFDEWTIQDIQDPAELARAGFFYTGSNDSVRCFYCGIGLRHWRIDDVPWVEHARWSGSCGLLCNASTGAAAATRTNGYTVNNNSSGQGLVGSIGSTFPSASSQFPAPDMPWGHTASEALPCSTKTTANPSPARAGQDQQAEIKQLKVEIKSLQKENRELKNNARCKICLDNEVEVVFLPCGHLVSCQACANNIKKCAVCRVTIKGSMRVYNS